MGKTVSIRCRRHKKRFDVEESWLETCGWLCPKCYHKLTEKERQRYAPKKGIKEKEGDEESFIGDFLDKRNRKGGEGVAKRETGGRTSMIGYSLKDLLPQYRIKCLRCGETVPCHKTWFENSKVLCPECYSKMTEEKIRKFHKEHNASCEGAEGAGEAEKVGKKCDKRKFPEWEAAPKVFNEDSTDIVAAVGGCSQGFIKRAPEPLLLQAVKRGHLSKMRFRIEMKRRQRMDYYADCDSTTEYGFVKN